MRTPTRRTDHRRHRLAALALLALCAACAADEVLTPPAGDTRATDAGAGLRPAGPLAIGAPRALPSPDGCLMVGATDINDRGEVIGWAMNCPDGGRHAVHWDAAGNWTYLPEVAGEVLNPFAIDNQGTIVAYTDLMAGDAHPDVYEIRSSGRMAPLTFPEGAGTVMYPTDGPNRTGTMLLLESAGGPATFHLWKGDARTTVLPAAPGGYFFALDLNDHGEVVGSIEAGIQRDAATWSRRGFRTLGLMALAIGSVGEVIDDAGRVYGSTEFTPPPACAETAFPVGRATIWDRDGIPMLLEGEPFTCAVDPHFLDVTVSGLAVGTLGYRVEIEPFKVFAATADGRWALASCALDGVTARDGCEAAGINRDGTVVGTWRASPEWRAVTWTVTGQ
ncbi:MAG TPA: hypothetical protein VFX50_13930 [Gemmatimonadales bacterium]|nr:hypothetical protein [Gemmatimonadales bacterium]